MKEKIRVKSDRKEKQICPVCKNSRKLTLHHILPKFIFRELKENFKNGFLNGNNSYWLCSRCHTKYESESTKLRKQMLNELNFPVGALNPFIHNKQLVKIKSLCRYMIGKFSKNAYDYSIYEAYNFLKAFYNKKYISYDKIIEYSKMRDSVPNTNYKNVGQFLIKKLGIKELDYIYRKSLLNFLNKRTIHKDNLISNRNKQYNEVRLKNITKICE